MIPRILTLAATLTPSQAGKLAHALGWPMRKGIACPLPHEGRNYYCAVPGDPDWSSMVSNGLALQHAHDTYSATADGVMAIRVYLAAVETVHGKNWRHVFAMRAEGLEP